MKANLFKKLRKQSSYFEVSHKVELGLIGEYHSCIVVLARNHKEAVYRACKRNHGWKLCVGMKSCSAQESVWRVKLLKDSAHWGNYAYYK